MRYDRAAKKLIGVCETCGKTVEIPCTVKQYNEYRLGLALIQDIFPKVPLGDREIFISRRCGDCFDKMFRSDEDEC